MKKIAIILALLLSFAFSASASAFDQRRCDSPIFAKYYPHLCQVDEEPDPDPEPEAPSSQR